MGLMDKFKNLFTDEEIIEEEEDIEEPVKIKEIKKENTKEHKLPTFMREKIEKEEKTKKEKINRSLAEKFEIKEEPKEPEESNIEINNNLNNEEPKQEKKSEFKFPVFDESDFVEPTRVSRHSIMKEEVEQKETIPIVKEHKDNKLKEKKSEHETKVSKLYKDKKPNNEEDKRFRASPIISPIFGVLDKNYIPSDVSTNNGDNYEINRRSKTIDFDSVRKKAYGPQKTLEDDIKENLDCKNCEYLKKAKSCKKKEQDNSISYESFCETNEEVYKDISIKDAEENYYDYGSIYEKKNEIEPIYLEETDEEEVSIINNVEEMEEVEEKSKRKKKGIPPVKNNINLLSTIKKSMGDEELEDKKTKKVKKSEKDLELTDDLFNLIDSMYEERDD